MENKGQRQNQKRQVGVLNMNQNICTRAVGLAAGKVVNSSMVIKIFDNEFLTCELDDSLPVLRHYWKKAPPGEQFKLNLLKVLKEYKTLRQSFKGLAWLADTTQLGELDEKTEDWLVEEWEDLLFAKTGVKIHAVILGESIFADYPMENFKRDAEQKFQAYNVHLGVFSSQEEAYSWIKEQLLIVN